MPAATAGSATSLSPFTDVAGKIVSTEGLERPRPAERACHQRRTDRMLRGSANPAQKQRQNEQHKARAKASQAVAQPGQGGPRRKHGSGADADRKSVV